MLMLLAAFVVSAIVSQLLVRAARSPTRWSSLWSDSDLDGPQKFHRRPVPRVGGVAIMVGLAGAVAMLGLRERDNAWLAWQLLGASLPMFVAGLAEDITKNVSPRRRLAFTALAAALLVWLLDATIERTDLPLLDTLVAYPLGALVVTVFVVTGVANSFNIIDGFNGLASMCGVLILLGVAWVAFRVGDALVASLALAGVGALLRALGYSLQSNRETKEGTTHPDRNAQFERINTMVKRLQQRGQPVISVDTKKKYSTTRSGSAPAAVQ